MNKIMTVAVALSLTLLFAVMLWAQAGRFDTNAAAARSDAHSSSFRSPYLPMRTLKPIY